MIYEFKCECGNKQDVHRRVAEMDDDLRCKCGKLMTRLISPVRAIWPPEKHVERMSP